MHLGGHVVSQHLSQPVDPMVATRKNVSARWAGPVGFVACLSVFIAICAGWGHQPPSTAAAGVATVCVLLINAGLIALVYLLSAFGYGRIGVWLMLRRQAPVMGTHWVQCVLGMGIMLWMSHALGMLGLLSGGRGAWVSWVVVVVGLVLLVWQIVRGSLKPESWKVWPGLTILAAPGMALLLVAASSPPSALWVGPLSEAGGYDVLSYHLQLPKEWALATADGGVGRLWPVEHNVYSYLPGYMEGAYLHLAAMMGGGRDGGGNFVNGNGMGLMACQYLHAGMGIVAALMLGRMVVCIGSRAYASDRARRKETIDEYKGGQADVPAILAFATMMSVPWVMVVGSLAYNELAVVAMGAGAVMIALDEGVSPRRRGLLVGLLAGIACSAKMTSVFFVVPMAGLVLLFARGCVWRTRMTMTLTGIAGGVAAMLPWMARNYTACGNPIFPFAHGVFGNSHWTDEQFRRFTLAHVSPGHGVMDHLTLLFSGDRGILHEQWSILFPLGLAALLLAAWMRPTRRIGVLLLVSLLIQLLAWMMFTHEQSRFLVPTLVPLCLGIGLGGTGLLEWLVGRSDSRSGPIVKLLGSLVLGLVPLSLATWGAQLFLTQRGGHPNLLLVAGVETITGHAYADELAQLSDSLRQMRLKEVPMPTIYVNYAFNQGDALYLLGPSTPLFYFPPDGEAGLWYNTTWDASPLGIAAREHPDDPAAWTAAVRHAMQARFDAGGRPLASVYVLVDYSEISRLYPADTRKQVWFDPVLTPTLIRRWLASQGTLVHSWPAGEEQGVYLYELREDRRRTP